MNHSIETLNAWSDLWLPYVLHAGWQGAVVGAALLAAVLFGRRWPSPLKHALLVVALLKFLVPPFAASPSGLFSYVAIDRNAAAASRVDTPTARQTLPTNDDSTRRATAAAAPREHAFAQGAAAKDDAYGQTPLARRLEQNDPYRSTVSPADQAAAAVTVHDDRPAIETALGWAAYLMLVHLAGSTLLSLALLWQLFRLRRLLGTGMEITDGDLHDRYRSIARRLGVRRLPRLLAVANIDSPFSCGVWRRAIVLPTGLVSGVSHREIDVVLAHELAHHRRRDLLVNSLQAAVFLLWWFHPVVWLLNSRLRAVREDCCDDLLLAEGLTDQDAYCDTLLRVATVSHSAVMPSLALPMSCQRTGLAHRFRRLMDASVPRAKRLSRRGFGLTVLLSAILLPGLGSGNQPAENSDTAVSNSADDRTEQSKSQEPAKESKRDEKDSGDDSKPAQETSRAWYILSQTDTSGLLNGLPQRLIQASTENRRETPVWQGIDNGARLKIRVETEGEVSGEVLVGFFKESNWENAEPAQVRSFAGPGEYTVEGLIPGKYWLGAVVGTVDDFAKSSYSLGNGAGMGVEKDWPKPLVLQVGQATNAHVRVSDKYRLAAMHDEQFRGHFGLWTPTKPEQLVTIKTVDAENKPLPYCSVTLNQLVKGDDTRNDRFHRFGTDENGVAYCDAFSGRFTVTVQKTDFIPELFAHRFRIRQFPKIYQVPLPFMMEVAMDPIPVGSATLSGRVHDQFGNPLREFYLTLSRHQQRAPFDWDTFEISMPFTSDDGSYSIPDVAPGTYTVRIRHFDYPTHVYRTGYKERTVTIPIEPNPRVHADFEVEAKELLYGRAVFDDGKPVIKGSWSARFGGQQWNYFAMNINDDGTFRVMISAEEKRKLTKYHRGMVQVSGRLSDNQDSTVDVPLAKLSRNADKPATIVIPSKPPAKATEEAEKKPASEDEGLPPDALAWISELKVLSGDKRTVEIADFKGKPIFLNLFGPWCPECIETIPELVKLHEEHAHKGLVVLVICRPEDSRQVEELVTKHKFPFLVATDVDGYAVDVFRVRRSEPGYPTNVVLDANHKRVFFEVGFAGEKLTNLHTAIQQALKSSQSR
jgi:beta-lactamase regulating signal transducer with metallopeptidase domain/thiol-disulfide isomerase/thioredoxin